MTLKILLKVISEKQTDKPVRFSKAMENKKAALETAFYNPDILTWEGIDPFGNRLTFTGTVH
jgi:hypothetical protein